jgi:hypothetical protein
MPPVNITEYYYVLRLNTIDLFALLSVPMFFMQDLFIFQEPVLTLGDNLKTMSRFNFQDLKKAETVTPQKKPRTVQLWL